ncbi:hypothetical protein CMU89_00660 [Elizabethkingia anophelis]|jgi:predicted nuclease of restriction endonuclease-like (RecB) superfamily|nr:hypothetical protein [Elizabethkingia anophelis]MDV3541182.1 hypothetical protein [Elizabethkingia anophelis]PKR31551.1 hypothetical protein CWH99_12365 [Elizabethkingia anophelis]PKR33840.1 hypothetical protein CWI00_17020 [Elizabethkingia anophelis]PRQ78332.1 hypothetical protein CMT60_18945 [Elizabethkingia anophelis]
MCIYLLLFLRIERNNKETFQIERFLYFDSLACFLCFLISYFFDALGLPDLYSEKSLEDAILQNLNTN